MLFFLWNFHRTETKTFLIFYWLFSHAFLMKLVHRLNGNLATQIILIYTTSAVAVDDGIFIGLRVFCAMAVATTLSRHANLE